jgi:hypothetical protein
MFGNRAPRRGQSPWAVLLEPNVTAEESNEPAGSAEIWNPCGECVDSLSAAKRARMETGQAWSYYADGGGGDPSYFDYPAWLKRAERQHSR